ncbi:hypothetical protein [Nocardia gipuzkoensis]|uniref:hypothetical protein n=1 Tax=Nocardia gipuzkoensis TaxID=2749991 RepID=UPI0015EE7A66|nr:hypothetical protein [Nocardia gipuzkoensis]
MSGSDTFPVALWLARRIRRRGCARGCLGFLHQRMSEPDYVQPDDLGKGRHGGFALKILTVLWRASDDVYLTVVMVTASRERFPVRAGSVDHPGPAQSVLVLSDSRSIFQRMIGAVCRHRHIASC